MAKANKVLSYNEKTWIEISKGNLASNFQIFRKHIDKNTKILSVVKANAYGHGLKEVALILKKSTDWFGVDNVNEAIYLRKVGINKLILILGYTMIGDLKKAITNNISLTVYNFETLRKIIGLNLKRKAKIHLKIETGTNRQGVRIENIDILLDLIERHKNIFILEGISTHFADVEDSKSKKFAFSQLSKFSEVKKRLNERGIKVKIYHCAASAATLMYPEAQLDMVRVGVGLYGLWPSEGIKKAVMKKGIILKPVLCWKSIIAQIRIVKKDETVGYGRTWKASNTTQIAVIPIGYSDGFDRKLSNDGYVLIKGRKCPVIGRVAMNMIMVDLRGVKGVKIEDEVVIIGKMGKEEITADEIAEKLETINYEIVSRINSSIKRIVI